VTFLLVLFLFWPLLLLLLLPKLGTRATILYTAGQLISWWATILGWFLLVWPCYKQRWVADAVSTNTVITTRTTIDRWQSKWLNPIWGNPEDGVSGAYAVIRDATGGEVPGGYMPFHDPRWRAYLWSAWRNSADGLKYLLEWSDGPLVALPILGRQVKFGWLPMPQIKGSPRVPVLG
jgi:hypothetical protein